MIDHVAVPPGTASQGCLQERGVVRQSFSGIPKERSVEVLGKSTWWLLLLVCCQLAVFGKRRL